MPTRSRASFPSVSSRRRRVTTRLARAFTLVELLVVVAILALLISLLVPSLVRARRQAASMRCASNLRQIAAAMHEYTCDYADRFPIAQYIDEAREAFVCWDTLTRWVRPDRAEPGLIWEYADAGEVQQCPAYDGPNLSMGDPYTGYNYNTSYIGRGQNEGAFLGMDESPAMTAQVRRPGATVLAGDGGFRSGANKFMRAPFDLGVSEGTAHAGAQAFRHLRRSNAAHADGHVEVFQRPYRKPGARPDNDALLGFPANGFLSAEDSPYSRF